MRRAVVALAAALLATSACTLLASCSGAAVRPEAAQLRVIARPDTAEVLVEGRYVGLGRTLAVRPVTLRPGTHHVTVQARGFFPHDLELPLPAGETVVRIALRPVPL